MARKPSANAKPKRRPKQKTKRTDKSQSERFIEAARIAGMDETGDTFEAAFKKLVPPKSVAKE